ncbi:MAG: metallophosphoesterase [Syntrophaceae bacterium]|nr:metallophosphoesterase [Syntrophaceae bacterium]
MKAFFSDLHLSDGKDRDDFQYQTEFDKLLNELSAEYRKVEIVFLGDIFDLIRTQKYYELEEEPFTEDKIRAVKRRVMEEIVENHSRFFETLRGFEEQPDHTYRYIVGNHDFGISLDGRLLEIIREKHGLTFTPENYYKEAQLGIWAEHGHRYDIINNTFNNDGTPIPYCLGDKIVVEIVNRFFEKVREKQEELGINPEIIHDLDNVRPQSAIVNWLDYIDETGQLKRLYYETITSFIVNNVDEVAPLIWDFLLGKYQPDLLKAARELAKKGVGKYIIFGHTHAPLDKRLAKGARHLNSGTWRKFIEPKGRPSTRMRTVPTYSEGGEQFYTQEPYFYYKFKSTINLSHVLFYEEGEGEVGPHLIQQEKPIPNG